MEAWWGSLSTAFKIFYAIGIASGAVLVVQLILMFFGLDGADDLDADAADLGHGDGGSILSLRTVTAFFVGFGWTGVAVLKAGHSVSAATLAGLGVGTLFMGAVAALMRLLYGMATSGTVDYHNAIGSVGQVYAPIAPNMEKPGQVEVLVQGRLRIVSAMTKGDERLATQRRVKVVDLVDENTLLVEPQ